MSHVRKSRRRTKGKGGNVSSINGYTGLWVGDDDSALDVLIRVRYATSYAGKSRGQIELIGEVVDAQELSKLDGDEKYTLLEAFPRRLVSKMPKRGIEILVERKTLGRPSRDSTFIPVTIRGTVVRHVPAIPRAWRY